MWDLKRLRFFAVSYTARQVDVFAVLAGVLRRLRIVFILLILSTRTVAIAVLLQVLLELLVCHLLILRVLQKLMAHTIAGLQPFDVFLKVQRILIVFGAVFAVALAIGVGFVMGTGV